VVWRRLFRPSCGPISSTANGEGENIEAMLSFDLTSGFRTVVSDVIETLTSSKQRCLATRGPKSTGGGLEFAKGVANELRQVWLAPCLDPSFEGNFHDHDSRFSGQTGARFSDTSSTQPLGHGSGE